VNASLQLSEHARSLLRCPACLGTLHFDGDTVECAAPECGRVYPLVDGIPVLINERTSVFAYDAFLESRPKFFKPVGKLRGWITAMLPTLDNNIAARRNFARFRAELKARRAKSRVLVIGGGILGYGMECLLDDPAIELIETDVAPGQRPQLICDAHDLPFADGSIDAVIAQAVLEHVLDPQAVVEEIYRVLGDQGIVYADTPFISQVHGREFDFTRFTYLGHRRLFRKFGLIDGGMTGGPGVALAWTLRYFVLSFFESAALRALASGLSRCAFFWLKYCDYYLIQRAGAKDAASAFYFMGQKQAQVLDDRELVASYEGGFR